MNSAKRYDVFLSHNSQDKPAVEELAHRLVEEAGLRPFLDKWHLIPGEPWQEAIEEALDDCASCVVFIGPSGIGPWQNEEMRVALEKRVHQAKRGPARYRVIPVLLPGAPGPEDLSLPAFLRRLTLVDFRRGLDDPDALHRLVAGIRGAIPVPFPPIAGQATNPIAWLRYLSWHRKAVARAVALLILMGLIIAAVAQRPPFQPRLGWQALGLKVKGAWRLSRAGDVLLVSTTTDFPGCKAVDTGLWRSTDRGATWEAIVAPLEFDPPGPEGCALAAITGFAQAPMAPQRIYASTTDAGLLRSDDSGENWTRIAANSLPDRLAHVVVEPSAPDHVFVAAESHGLYRSLDGGQNWERLDGAATCPAGAEGMSALPEMLDVGAMLATGDAIYVGTDEPEDAGAGAGLYASRDGGDCWQRVDDAEGRYEYMALADVPGTTGQLVVLTCDHSAVWGKANFHLWRLQADQGRTRLLWESRHTTATLYVTPGTPSMWYVATDLGEVFRGPLDKPGTKERLPRLTRCALPPACLCDLAPDFEPGPPLLLADDRVFRLQIGHWFHRLWP